MAGIGISFEVKGIEELRKKLTKDTVQSPLQKAIKEITLLLHKEVRMATPVGTPESTGIKGYYTQFLRVRGIYSKIEPLAGKVGAILSVHPYAIFVEFGTQKMEARHVEGGTRVFGQGMFAYALEKVKDRMAEIMQKIGREIEARFNQ